MVKKEIVKIGEKQKGTKQPIFELIIDDHVPYADPSQYKIKCDSINPRDYFITSGDAVQKARILEKELWQLAGNIKKGCCEKGAKRSIEKYEKAVWSSAGKARSMVNKLIKARGDACFFETEWNSNHQLLCIPKNPRKRVFPKISINK